MGNALYDTISEADIPVDFISGRDIANHDVSIYDFTLLSVPGQFLGKDSELYKILVSQEWKPVSTIVEMSNPWDDSFTKYQRAIELQEGF